MTKRLRVTIIAFVIALTALVPASASAVDPCDDINGGELSYLGTTVTVRFRLGPDASGQPVAACSDDRVYRTVVYSENGGGTQLASSSDYSEQDGFLSFTLETDQPYASVCVQSRIETLGGHIRDLAPYDDGAKRLPDDLSSACVELLNGGPASDLLCEAVPCARSYS